MFDIYTIIFLALAVFIFLRLRSVLGQRTGRERRRYDTYSPRDAVRTSTNDNVVTLPGRNAEPPPTPSEPVPAAAKGKAAHLIGITIVGNVEMFMYRSDKGAAPKTWDEVKANADKNKAANFYGYLVRGKATNPIVADFLPILWSFGGDVFDQNWNVTIDNADITSAELRARVAQVTVRFVSQLISVTRNRSGTVIEGSPDKVTEVTDIWTFARDTSARDPNWKLVATEAGQ